MQLDRTHVVIRLRSLSEIGDLALVMLRRYPGSLTIGFFVGMLPWAILDLAALAWIPISEAEYGEGDPESAYERYRYLSWMMLLVVAQTPAAGVATTFYIGQAVFEHRPTWSSVFAQVRRHFWRWFWVLGMKRLALPVALIPLIRLYQPRDVWWDFLLPLVCLVAIVLIRNARPFAPEILLLEQCPLRSRDPQAITYRRRSKALHSPISGELSGRFFAVSFVLFWLFLSTLYTLVWARGVTTGQWNWDLFSYLVIYPAALWMVAGVSVIVRLLCYLDTRIRLEGWEVELAIRAEALRQFGEQVAPLEHSPSPQAPRDGDEGVVAAELVTVVAEADATQEIVDASEVVATSESRSGPPA